jgi:hypothetical protein
MRAAYIASATQTAMTVFDEVKLLRKFDGGGEHGVHAVLCHRTRNRSTRLREPNEINRLRYLAGSSRLERRPPPATHVGRKWFYAGCARPGWLDCSNRSDGKNWELIAVGFRNEFDAAFNRDGELFAYDADMEWI